jgi:hypothetical protein
VSHAAAAPTEATSPARTGRTPVHARRPSRSQGDPAWEFVVLLLGVLIVGAAGAQVIRSRRHSIYRHQPDGATITVIDPRLADRVPGEDELPVT